MKYRIGLLLIGLLLILYIGYTNISGKSEHVIEPTPSVPNIENTDNNNQSQTFEFKQFLNADKIQVYDQYDNLIIETNDKSKTTTISQYFNNLHINHDAPLKHKYNLTFYVKDDSYNLIIYSNGILFNGQYMQFPNPEQNILLIQELDNIIINNFWDKIIDVEKIYINADDIIKTIAINDKDINQVVNIMKNSFSIIEERELFPVYPNYSLELTYNDKKQVDIKLLNQDLIGINIANKNILLQIDKELWGIIDHQVPKPTYNKNDLAYLFHADNLDISSPNSFNVRETKIKREFRDQIIRELLISLPDNNDNMTILFELSFDVDDERYNIKIEEQGFWFLDQYFRSTNIKDRILNIIAK